jgi:hypothetical protein
MIYVKDVADLEKQIKDERERPYDYKNHFYPCHLMYEPSWDAHFCGDWYWVDKTPEETLQKEIEIHRTRLQDIAKEQARLEQVKADTIAWLARHEQTEA